MFMLLFVAVFKPLLAPTGWGPVALEAGLVLTLISCIGIIGHNRKGVMVASAWAVIPALALVLPSSDLALVPARLTVMVVFLLYATFSILLDVFSGQDASVDKLFGSVCAYLMVGICFGMVYLSLDVTVAGSFSFGGVPSQKLVYDQWTQKYSEFVYYSFITMTTVGYGDILPLSAAARSVAMTQAVFGQFYMALMVGRLLAMHLSTISNEPESKG